MKKLIIYIICLLIFKNRTVAQTVPINEPDYNKPKLFSDLPDSIPVSTTKLLSLFAIPESTSASIEISGSFSFEGYVLTNISKSNNTLQTLLIRLTSRSGSTFAISKITQPGREITITGRIISLKHSDGYTLIAENNNYWFKKIKRHDLVVE